MFFRDKTTNLVRRVFRGALLVVLGASMMFFALIVALRIQYRDQGIYGPMQTTLFQLDVKQYHARAYFGDDVEDMRLAEQLLRYGIFSPIYSDAGVAILRNKAADGHAPAKARLAELNLDEL